MNVFELFTVFYVLFTGYFCGKYLSLYYGFAGNITGFIIGCIVAVIAYNWLRKKMGIIPQEETKEMKEKESEEFSKYLMLSSIPLRKIDESKLPCGTRTGCLLKYNKEILFLTVSHKMNKQNENWCIETEYDSKKGTKLLKLAFYFAKIANLNDTKIEDIDFCFAKVPIDICPYYQLISADGIIIEQNERVILDLPTDPFEHKSKVFYGFAGQPANKIISSDRPILVTNPIAVTDMEFLKKEKEFIVFKLPVTHPGHDFFEGCSGAPIIDSEKRLVALLVGGNVENNLIYGISIDYCKTLIQIGV